MASRCDEVEKNVHSVVSESWITLDSGLLCENVVVLAFKVSNNFAEAGNGEPSPRKDRTILTTYLASLSI